MRDSLFAKEATGFLLKKLLCRRHNILLVAPAALEQQITNHYLSSLRHDSSFKKKLCVSTTT